MTRAEDLRSAVAAGAWDGGMLRRAGAIDRVVVDVVVATNSFLVKHTGGAASTAY